jgi:hypothetical protein
VSVSSEIRAELRMLHVVVRLLGGDMKAIMFSTLLLTEGDE